MKTVDKYQFNQSKCFMEDGISTVIALHTVLKKKFAVKMIAFGTDREKENNNYIARQCQILKKIAHQNVYRCHKLLKSKNNFYAVFDLIEGKPLQQLLNQEASIFKQVVQFLLELRARSIVYININPSNIIVSQNYKIMFKNFGLAQLFQNGQQEKNVTFTKENSPYFAPQLTQGKVYKNSDFYSFGVLISALFQPQFKISQTIKQTITIGLQKFGVNVCLSIEKIKKIAEELSKKDSRQRADLKEILTCKKAYIVGPSPQKLERCLSSKTISKNNQRSPKEANKRQTQESKSTSIITFCEEKKRQRIQQFQSFLQIIIKKRGLTALFLKISQAILKCTQPQIPTAIQLSFLLVKKATVTLSELKKLISKGFNKQYFIIQKHLQSFQSQQSFKYFAEVVGQQLSLTKKKYQYMVAEIEKMQHFSKNQNLQLQIKNENVNERCLKRTVLEFLLQLNLIFTDTYVSQFKKDQLHFIFICSLLSQFNSFQEIYSFFFSQEVTEIQKQPFYKQLSLIPKIKLVELIEKNTSKLNAQNSENFDLSIQTIKTIKSIKTNKSIE